MSRRPTLALCIPAYKAEAYLQRILGSAKKQLIPFDETVVYDDASPDGTAQLAETLGARVIRGETNRGCTWARKVMAESVQSDWIHFHDADDDMTERFTTLAHAWMARSDAPDVVLFNYDWIDDKSGELLGRVRFDKSLAEEDAVLFTLKTQVNPFCGLYRKSRFLEAGGPDLDPEVRQCEDMAMHCKLAIQGLSFSVEAGDPVMIINYRQSQSMSRGPAAYKKLVHAILRLYRKNYEELKSRPHGKKYLDAIGLRMWVHTRHAAWVSEWKVVRASIELARRCGVAKPESDSQAFRFGCSVSSFAVVVLREIVGRMWRKKDSYWY